MEAVIEFSDSLSENLKQNMIQKTMYGYEITKDDASGSTNKTACKQEPNVGFAATC